MTKPYRILYAAGPGNVIETYKHWVNGQDDPSQVSITYSAQFYEVCRALGAEGYIISSSNQREFLRDSQFTIEHRPVLFQDASGVLYHLGQVWYGLGLIFSALRWQANLAIVTGGATHWFVLSLLPYFGVKIVPSMHCALWRKYIPKKMTERLILRLNRQFFTKTCTAILAVSKDISEQIEECTGGQHRPIVEFLPSYRRGEFDSITAPDEHHSPFRVLFVGRIERVKGAVDLLEIAQRFASEGRQDIRFDLCGTGSELESLRLAARHLRVDSSFVCHGYCNKLQMHQMFCEAHLVIVPTTTAFVEGFCKVVAEGILAGRPVITSAVVPALSYVRDAIVEVSPDDVKGYEDALLNLCNDREFYEAKRRACFEVQEQFYDTSRGWADALKSVLMAMQ